MELRLRRKEDRREKGSEGLRKGKALQLSA